MSQSISMQQKRGRLKLFLPLIIFLVLCLMFYVALFRVRGELPSAMLDNPFPEFNLPTVNNPDQFVNSKDLIGEVALVNVWATWCSACMVEHPYLLDLFNQGVQIYGVNSKDNQDDARMWLKKFQDPYRFSINDQDGTLGIDLGVYGSPETYLIDEQGVIRYRHVGIVNSGVWNNDLKPRYEALQRAAKKSLVSAEEANAGEATK